MASNTTQNGTRRERPAPEYFVGKRIRLRPVHPADLPALQVWDEDPEITALMGRKFEQTRAEDWLKSVSSARSCRALALETNDGRLIGELELAHMNWREGSAEIRICIGAKDCWGQGYGTEALQVLFQLAFIGYGLRSLYLRVFTTNERAVHCYRKLGFRTEAVMQPCARRQDPAPIYLMRLTKQAWERAQARIA